MNEFYDGKWDVVSDIVIVGFGGAGGCAAIEAHDAGSKVVLLEKQPENRHYSNTRMSGGGYHSPNPAGDKEALKAYAKALFSGENLPWKFEGDQTEFSDGLAELWADFAPQNAAFMSGLDPDYIATPSGGAAFPNFPGAIESGYRNCNSNYNRDAIVTKPYCSPNTPKENMEAGEAFHACIQNGILSRNIPVHYGTKALKLLHDKNGAIAGVKAERNGDVLYYRANKAVILTSGGYEYSKALRSAFLDGPSVDGWAFYGTSANTGDGIIMGMEAGAALSKVGSAAGRLIASFSDLRAEGIRIGVHIPSIGRDGAIVVDNLGSRFCNERLISMNPTNYISYKYALLYDVKTSIYPRIPSWFIFDEILMKRKSLTLPTITEYFDVQWSQDNHEAVERGWILKANTIEELGRKIKEHPDNHDHMDVEAFCKSVIRFNDLCAQGEDKDYSRPVDTLRPIETPPFYAIPLFPGGPNTKGGLKANEKRQVVDWNGNIIPRLYAAGEISSVFKFLYQSGGNLAECIVCGRVAGINASKENM